MMISHPIGRHWWLAKIAGMSWWRLARVFVLLIVGIAAVLALLRQIYYPSLSLDRLLDDFAIFVLVLIDVRDATDFATGLTGIIFAALAGFTKLVLIAGLFGSVVFKFMVVQDVFCARRKLSVYRKGPDQPWQLVARIYNTTRLNLVDINFEVYLRVPASRGTTRVVSNDRICINKGRDCWPISIQYIPYSIDMTLCADDVDPTAARLLAIQSHTIDPKPQGSIGESFLVLLIKGKQPDLNAEFIETHWFQLSGPAPAYEFGRYQEIDTQPGERPREYGGNAREWNGWSRFEDIEQSPSADQAQ